MTYIYIYYTKWLKYNIMISSISIKYHGFYLIKNLMKNATLLFITFNKKFDNFLIFKFFTAINYINILNFVYQKN